MRLGIKSLYLFVLGIFFLINLNAQQVGNNIRDIAPEIKLKDPNGQEVTLSSLRGKLVIVDFWASWCIPCIKTNAILVKMYKKYKGKKFVNGLGFTIFSVSLDKTKLAWTNAINHDKLTWPYHGSNLKLWDCPAIKAYGIDAIPVSILIDGNGVILAKFSSLKELDKLLSSYLKVN